MFHREVNLPREYPKNSTIAIEEIPIKLKVHVVDNQKNLVHVTVSNWHVINDIQDGQDVTTLKLEMRVASTITDLELAMLKAKGYSTQ